MKNIEEIGIEEELKQISLVNFRIILDITEEPSVILNLNFQIVAVNDSFCDCFKVLTEQVEGEPICKFKKDQSEISELKKLLENILPDKKSVRNYKINLAFSESTVRVFSVNALRIDSVGLVVLIMKDVTEIAKSINGPTYNTEKDFDNECAERIARIRNYILELEQLNKLMVDRELEMIELKRKISDIGGEVGK